MNRVGFTWLTNLSLPDLRGELSRLPDHAVVLYLTIFQDATGASFTPRQALASFAPASRAPIYGFRSSPAFARVASGETGATRPRGGAARILQGIRGGARDGY